MFQMSMMWNDTKIRKYTVLCKKQRFMNTLEKNEKFVFFSLQTWNIEIVTEYAEHIWMLAEKIEE